MASVVGLTSVRAGGCHTSCIGWGRRLMDPTDGASHYVKAHDHYRDWRMSDAELADGAEDHPPARMSLGGRADHEQGRVAGGRAQRRPGLSTDDAAHHRHAWPFAGESGL